MAKEIIRTDNAPAPLGGAPYNQAVKSGNLVFLAGQIPLDAETGALERGQARDRAAAERDRLQAELHGRAEEVACGERLGERLKPRRRPGRSCSLVFRTGIPRGEPASP